MWVKMQLYTYSNKAKAGDKKRQKAKKLILKLPTGVVTERSKTMLKSYMLKSSD